MCHGERILDWNTGIWTSALRFWLAAHLLFSGSALVVWGMVTLGAKRTSGLPGGLVAKGAYLLTRNPRYVGEFLLFVGVAVLADSGVMTVTHLLTALVLLLAPFAEEPWLESEYGKDYVTYRGKVPRYV